MDGSLVDRSPVRAAVARLVRHDRLVAWNAARATFAGWPDRVIAGVMLLVGLAMLRAWVADRPWPAAAWLALGAGTLVGVAAGHLVAARFAFHAFDGVLAADALDPRARRRAGAVWLGAGLALLAAVIAIARPSLLIGSVPGYVAGLVVAWLVGRVAIAPRLGGVPRAGWTMRAWSRRPIAGVTTASVLLLSLLPARTLDANVLAALAGIAAVTFLLLLTGIDDAVVRFMTLAGHPARRIIVHHAAGAASFLAVAVPGCWIMLVPVAAGVVGAAGLATLLILTLRALAYRLHARRFADILVSVLAAMFLLVAYSVPVALPVVIAATLWRLQRRGRARRWLLA